MDLLKELIRELRKPRRKPKSKKQLCGVVVDMLDYYLSAHSSGVVEAMVENQLSVIDYLNQANFPVVALEYKNRGRTIPPIRKIIRKNHGHEYFVKENNDGFLDTGLLSKLRELGSEHLVVMGINESFCVFETCQSGFHYGFQISTAKDLIGDPHDPEIKDRQRSVRRWYGQNCVYYPKTTPELLMLLGNNKT